jgi:hypothetical protein
MCRAKELQCCWRQKCAALRSLIRTFLFVALGAIMTTIPARAQSLAADPALIHDLVAANPILYDQGVVDGFGHVSVRHDKNPEHFGRRIVGNASISPGEL